MLFGAVALHRGDRLRHAEKRSISKWTETPEWTLTRLGRMAWNIKPGYPKVVADRVFAVDSPPFEDFRSVMAKTCAPTGAKPPEPRLPALLALKSTRRLLVLGTYLLPVHRRFAPLFSPIQADGAFSAY